MTRRIEKWAAGWMFLAAAPLLLAADIAPPWQAALDRITPDGLRADVSFLASDALGGRGTPSQGLDIAAEFIASQFRRAGLQPAGDDGFFQTSSWLLPEGNPQGFLMELTAGARTTKVPVQEVILPVAGPLDLSGAEVFRMSIGGRAPDPESGSGKVVLVVLAGEEGQREVAALVRQLMRSRPAAVVLADTRPEPYLPAKGQIHQEGAAARPLGLPVITVRSPEFFEAVSSLPMGAAAGVKLKLWIAAPSNRTIRLRNVVAVLPGSDPLLKDSYLVLDAHYDHVGIGAPVAGDTIYNGANDDASGIASMLEVAATLARLPTRPKRTIAFAAYFGEELGMLGSRYFAGHPVFPVAKIIGALSLEQTGRTDSDEGPRVLSANLTGFRFSTLSESLVKAGEATGVRVWDDEKHGDDYFAASDNVALAEVGIPAHTLSVTYAFPDYHRPGDHWDKLDYENMAKVTRTVALGVLMLADDTSVPRWNESIERVKRYAAARSGTRP